MINQLHIHYRCRWDKEKNPIEYGQIVSDIVDAIYEAKIETGQLAARMTAFRATWKYQRWPTQAELLEILNPAQSPSAPPPRKPEKQVWAERVMILPEGQQALRDGFGRELYRWAEDNPGTIPGTAVMDDCLNADGHFRDTLAHLIDTAKTRTAGKGNLGVYAMAATLKAAGQMEGFETKLRTSFLDQGRWED